MYVCVYMHAHTLQNLNFWKFFLSRLIPTSSDGILWSLLKDSIMQIFRLGLLTSMNVYFTLPSNLNQRVQSILHPGPY